jgi:hypothetical protein
MLNRFRKLLMPLVLVALGVMSVVSAPPVQAAATSSYTQNHILDQFRGQTGLTPATLWVTLDTTTGSAQACGTEVSGGSFARVSITASLANLAGTQGAGTTSASSNNTGSSGTTSNNNAITFAAPTANWGTIVGFCIFDASSGGNLLFYAALTTPKTVNNGDASPSFAASALTITLGDILRQHGAILAANDPLFQQTVELRAVAN